MSRVIFLCCVLVLALPFVAVAQMARSEAPQIGVLIEAMENGEQDKFLELIRRDPGVVFDQDKRGFTILDYALVTVGEEQKLLSYPEMFKLSWLEAQFGEPVIKERLIARALMALGTLDNEKTDIALTEDMRSGIHRSEIIELIVFMTDRSKDVPALNSGDLAVLITLQVCDKEVFREGDLQDLAIGSLTNISEKIPPLRRQFLQSYVVANLLSEDCLKAFEAK